MIIYLDITQLEKGRANTGIQRVVKEFLKNTLTNKKIQYNICRYNENRSTTELLSNDEIEPFLQDIENYQFKIKEEIDLKLIYPKTTTILFEIDSNWNIAQKREKLYPVLKQNGFLIFNFIYDLVPIIFPEYTHEVTAANFNSFLKAVYDYSDLVFFDSLSACEDFMQYKKNFTQRDIPTRVVGLGSDFIEPTVQLQNDDLQHILDTKYILFVGTIEPRKNQEDVLDAFELLADKYPDLNLVIIGRKGWKVDALIQRIQAHNLINKRFFWLNDIDDIALRHFYKNAFLVTYLSKYEGYGLPIVESLSYANVIITSKNSSMYEAGRNYADYIFYESLNELIGLISYYYENPLVYNEKKVYIKENFKPLSWKKFSTSIENVFANYQKSLELTLCHAKKLQFVFISIDKENLEKTIKLCDKYFDFVKEYIVVTTPKLINKIKGISSSHDIIVVDEKDILKEFAKDFHKRDHQSKNWLLRASLLSLDFLENEFIMLDDDNQPLKPLSIDKFVSKDGRYNAFYFYSLLDWHNCTTEYDKGQQNMKSILIKENYELLSYSSHCPQIINKKIFQEVVDKFFDLGLTTAIDEWSIYFNYAVSLYPCSFNKKIYETLAWPAELSNWEQRYIPNEISFENYYQELYDIKKYTKADTYETKIAKYSQELKPYLESKEIFKKSIKLLAANNLVHPIISFQKGNIQFCISNIPYFVVLRKNSDIKLKLNYKLINPDCNNLDISVVLLLNGNFRTMQKLTSLKREKYQEDIFNISVNSVNIDEGMYDITIDVMIGNSYVYKQKSPYLMKLIVSQKDLEDIVCVPLNDDKVVQVNKNTTVKQKIKSLPFVDWFARWINNILRLNNLKHKVVQQQYHITQLAQQLQNQNKQLTNIKTNLETKLTKQLSREMFFKSLSFQQRIDQFIFDAKIELKNSSKNSTMLDALESLPKTLVGEYYLAYENHFKGSRSDNLKKMREYLSYCRLQTIKKALDIGCKRGEWVEVLQDNAIEAYGIDTNYLMLEEGIAHKVKNLQTIDVFKFLPFQKEKSFDLVTIFYMIEHISRDKLLVLLKEIKRVLSKNGQIVVKAPSSKKELLVFTLDFLGYKNIFTNEKDHIILAFNE